MIRDDVMKKLEEVGDLPTLSAVVVKLNKMLNDENVNAEDIGKLIADDVSIMSKVLRTVNSSAYGLSREVESIAQAVSMLGEKGVRNIAMSASAVSAFDIKSSGGFDIDEFWKHSISVGIAMNVLYEKVENPPKISKDMLHLCGLMHGIGILTLVQYFFIKFVMSMRISQNKNIGLCEAEKQVLDIDHCEIGAWLANKWQLPEGIVNVIKYHSNPEESPEDDLLVNLAHTAVYICRKNDLGKYGGGNAQFYNHIWKKLGFGVSDIPVFVKEIKTKVAESELFELI